jgi:hypothetical protein
MPFTPYTPNTNAGQPATPTPGFKPYQLPQQAMSQTPIQKKPKKNILTRVLNAVENNPLKRMGESIGQAALKRTRQLKDIYTSDQNIASKTYQALGKGAQFVGDVVGTGVGEAARDVYDVSARARSLVEPGSVADIKQADKMTLENVASQLIKMPAGAQALAAIENGMTGWNKFKAKHPETAANIEATVNIADVASMFFGAGIAKKAGTEALENVGEQGIKTAAKVVEGVTDLAGEAKRLGQQGLEMATPAPVKRLKERVGTNLAAKAEEKAVIQQLPPQAENAIKNGVDIQDAQFLADEFTDAEKSVFKEIKDTASQFISPSKSKDPMEVAGSVLQRKFKDLDKVVKARTKALKAVVSEFDGERPTGVYDSAIQALRSVPGLEDIRVSPSGQLSFKGTRMATDLTIADRKFIQKAWNGMKGKSSKGLHTLRQELFDALEGAKRGQKGYAETTDQAVEAIRKGIADVLDNTVPGYKEANMAVAQALQPLQDLRKMFKITGDVSEDILNARAGNLMRRLTSNAPSGIDLRKSLDDVGRILTEAGVADDVNPAKVQDFVDLLHRYYNLTKNNALAGQFREGAGELIPRSPTAQGIVDKTLGAVTKKIGEFTSITPDVRKKAFEDFFESLFSPKAQAPNEGQKIIDELLNLAPDADLELRNISQSLADRLGGSVDFGPIKTRENIQRKVVDDYDGNLEKVEDVVRTTLIIPDKEAALNELSKIAIRPPKIIKAEDNPLGFSGINAKVKLKNGLIGEIQANTPAMVYGKISEKKARKVLGDAVFEKIKILSGLEPEQNHKLYELWRVIKDKNSPVAKKIAREAQEYNKKLSKIKL